MPPQEYRRALNAGYVRHPACEDDSRCVYCGEPASERDHFLPLKYAHLVNDLERVRLLPLKFTVPSCHSCNAIANDKVFRSVSAKRQAIHKRLREKNRRLIATPDWSDYDREGTGWGLLTLVNARQSQRQRLLARLRYQPGYPIRPLFDRGRLDW